MIGGSISAVVHDSFEMAGAKSVKPFSPRDGRRSIGIDLGDRGLDQGVKRRAFSDVVIVGWFLNARCDGGLKVQRWASL